MIHSNRVHYNFTDRALFVTGGTSGIGLATARAFGKSGGNVVISGRGVEAGERARASLASDGITAEFVAIDVRVESSVVAGIDTAQRHFGRLDFALNCAGAGGDMKPLESTDQAVWDDVMAVNARGVWLAMRHEIPAILATGGGSIVNMNAIYACSGRAAHHAYVASKHAVLGMTRSVALEYATRGVRVNTVCAGITATASMKSAERLMPDLVGELVNEHPMRRMATEEDLAAAVLWLCSDAAGYVTGAPVHVDGGFSAA